MEATFQNKMRLDKCEAYTAKETLGYRQTKFYVSAERGTAKREEKQRDRRRNKSTDKLLELHNKEER